MEWWAAVIIAAFGPISALLAVWLTNRHNLQAAAEERQQAKDERAQERGDAAELRQREVRTAARLVQRELDHAKSAFAFAHEEQRWWWEDLDEVAWNEHGPLLAAILIPEEWDLVRAAYDEVIAAERARRTGSSFDALGAGPSAALLSMARCEAGILALERYASAPLPSILPEGAQPDDPGYRASLAALKMLGAPTSPPDEEADGEGAEGETAADE